MQTLLIIALLGGPAWTHREAEVTLDASQVTGWEITVASLAPGLAAIGIRQLHCNPSTHCQIKQLRAGTIEDFDNAELAATTGGWRVRFVGENAGIVTWVWISKFVDVAGPKLATMTAWAGTVWSSVPLGKTKWFTVQRRPEGEVVANLEWGNGGNWAEYLAALKAGRVKERNGNQ